MVQYFADVLEGEKDKLKENLLVNGSEYISLSFAAKNSSSNFCNQYNNYSLSYQYKNLGFEVC